MIARERARLRDRTGASIAFIAMMLVVLLGMTALAVDLGMLLGARTEAQRVADSAALAGAMVLTGAANDEEVARATAIDWASRNTIRNLSAEVLPEDVDYEPDNWLVRVRVLRTDDRGSAIANMFARAIGIFTSDVSAVAAARRWPTSGANCLLPFVLPDRWWVGVYPGEGSSTTGPFPTEDDIFDPDADDVYVPYAEYNEAGEMISGPNEPHSSYNELARGTEIRLKTSTPQQTWGPAIYFPIRFPGMQPGGKPYEDRIAGCPDPETVWYPGMRVRSEPGNKIGPTEKGFSALLAQAPNHQWRDSGVGVTDGGCVWDPDRAGGAGCITAWESPRTRVVSMFDPREFINNPSEEFRISTFAGVFVDRVQGNDVYVRFVEYRGADALPPEAVESATPVNPLGWMVRLVE